MSKLREIFVASCCLALICGVIYLSWQLSPNTSRDDTTDPLPSLSETLQEKAFLWEAQLAVYLQHLLKSQGQDKDALWRGMLSSLDSLHPSNEAATGEAPPINGVTPWQRKKLILAYWFELEQETRSFCNHLRDHHENEAARWHEIDAFLLALCSNAKPSRLSQNLDVLALKRELGWFAQLVLFKAYPPTSDQELEQTWRTLNKPSERVFLIFTLVSISMILSLVLLLLFAFLGAIGSLKSRFVATKLAPTLLLEIFTLYLAAMLLAPLLIKYANQWGWHFNVLLVNIAYISSLSLLAFWPLLWKGNAPELEQALGLQPVTKKRLLRDICCGPICYFAGISALLLIMAGYSLLLSRFGYGADAGTHPIIPILSATGDPKTLCLIFVMAVVVAPFVEELMFRGALYYWLRCRLGPFLSVFISSLIFAAVHPQGLVGIVPLSCIGMMLGFLREWRGTLTSSIIAHACVNAGTLTIALALLR